MSVNLQAEIWLNILRYADYSSLKTLLRTSKTFHPILAHSSFDEALFRLPTTRTINDNVADNPENAFDEYKPKTTFITFHKQKSSVILEDHKVHPYLAKWVDHIKSDWPQYHKDLKVWPLRPAVNTDQVPAREWSFTETCIPTESAVWPPITSLRAIVSSYAADKWGCYYENELGYHSKETSFSTVERPDGVTVADLMDRFLILAGTFNWGPTDGWVFEWKEKRGVVGGIGVATGLKEARLKLDIGEPWSEDEDE